MQLKVTVQMPQKTLSEWLSLLEVNHPTEIEFGLNRIARVAMKLGFSSSEIDKLANSNIKEENRLHGGDSSKIGVKHLVSPAKKIIMVGGTNGKGSCVAILDGILRAAGHKVGTYTSPHLIRYNERISINGCHATDAEICSAFEEIELARGPISLSYFEFSTLAALLIMASEKLDFAILEVGLGGRLDAINFMDPCMSIITSIALDHQDWLGHDLDGIGAEKAGIGRKGIPLIYGDMQPIQGVLDIAGSLQVKLLINGQDFSFEQFGVLAPAFLPAASVACGLQAAVLLDPSLSSSLLEEALSLVRLDGRYQRLCVDGVNIILDVAHNPQASELLSKRLVHLAKGRIVAIAGMMSDKDILGILKPMMPIVDTWYFCDMPGNSRASRARNIASIYNDHLQTEICKQMHSNHSKPRGSVDVGSEKIEVFERESSEKATKEAISNAKPTDTVVIFGSFFAVGPVLNWLKNIN